jgi:hypothetical protein
MKTKLFFLLILSAAIIISCVNSNKPLTDSEKEKVIAEASDFVNTLYQAIDDVNTDKLAEIYDSTLFFSLGMGKIMNYKEFFDIANSNLAQVEKFKIEVLDSRFAVLDKTTVFYGDITRSEVTFKDSSIVLAKPWHSSYLLKKVNSTWKVIGDVSYGHTEITRISSLKPELNQLELYKKNYLGTWQTSRNDTMVTSTYKPLGAGAVEGIQKVELNGKVLNEIRSIIAYSREFNVMTSQQVNLASGGGVVFAQWFLTPTKSQIIPFTEIKDPNFSHLRFETEFTSPDTRVQKRFIEGKLTMTTTYKKIN